MMEPTIKKQWVKALRSGAFKQTKNKLCRNGRFCCLGVLATLHPAVDSPTDKEMIKLLSMAEENGMPHDDVLEWAGLKPQEACLLATKNDDGHTFPEIADYIEATL
jgi:hypothetical protein